MFASFTATAQRICDQIAVMDGRLKLNKNEKVLICGDAHAAPGWREVPLSQAQFQLGNILHNRGYFNARFEVRESTLYVWKGPRTETKKMEIEGDSGILDPGKKRKVVDYPLSSEKLDEAKQWAELELRRRAYACARVTVTGQAWDQTLKLKIEPDTRRTIGEVDRSGLGYLDPDSLARYEAYHVGEAYDVILTQITATRLLNQGLFQSAYFTTDCKASAETVKLHLFTDVGKPRLLRFALGASTEEFPFADLRFKNSRLDRRASSYTLGLHASNRKQSFTGGSELYIVPKSKRTYLGPRFQLERRSESSYELLKTSTGADLGRAWDWWRQRWVVAGGPTLNYEKTVRGIGPADLKYLSWEGSLSIASHEYEAFFADQFEGYAVNINYHGQRRGLGSSINVDRYDLAIKYLWNIGAFSPPLFVLATKLGGTAVDINQAPNSTDRSSVPIDYRVFYGGDDNLRGFSRQSLNNGDLGYLTAAHASFELRLIAELPYRIEPFLLADVARLGTRRYTLDPPIFTSSGLGLRWGSPFGTVRGSAAKGRIWHGDTTSAYPQEWVYFVSFGQEF